MPSEAKSAAAHMSDHTLTDPAKSDDILAQRLHELSEEGNKPIEINELTALQASLRSLLTIPV